MKKIGHNLGKMLRALREQQREPLRIVASALGIDPTLVSKFERGERIPSEEYIAKFACYYGVSFEILAAQAIADRIIMDYGNRDITLKAVNIVREQVIPYLKEQNNDEIIE